MWERMKSDEAAVLAAIGSGSRPEETGLPLWRVKRAIARLEALGLIEGRIEWSLF